VGLIVAFVTALVAVKFFILLLSKYGFKHFGYYRIALGILFLVLAKTMGLAM
jgi:undecaprenyl-diphosphatase